MFFLNWWQNNKEESDSQLSLLGDSQPLTLHERVDGATVYKDFTKAVKDAGGSDRSYARAVRAETQELFDCGVDELYESTGARRGDRTSLPKEAQKAYMVSETISTHRLNHDVREEIRGSQKQKDDEIVETVRDTAEHVRKWLPWQFGVTQSSQKERSFMSEHKLKVLMKPCDSGMCPVFYQDKNGRVFVQGTKLGQVNRDQITLTEDEEVVQISPDLLTFLRTYQA